MSDNKDVQASQSEPIPPDPQLSMSPKEQPLFGHLISPMLHDPIGLDPLLSSELQKSYKPEIIALDPQLTSQVIEHSFSPQKVTENKIVNQPDTTKSSGEE